MLLIDFSSAACTVFLFSAIATDFLAQHNARRFGQSHNSGCVEVLCRRDHQASL